MEKIPKLNRHAILNTYVNDLTMDETVAEVERIVEAGVPTQHVVVNASKVNLMEDDPELRSIVNECPLINADGASIVWAARILGIPLRERVTGIDLFLRLVELAPQKGWGVYLFGAKEEVVRKVKSILEERYPGIRIVGVRNGYFTEDEEPTIVADMAASGADLMFVAFSSPKKEYWVHRYLDRIGIPFVMGVAAASTWLPGSPLERRCGCRGAGWSGSTGSFKSRGASGGATSWATRDSSRSSSGTS